MSDQTVQKAPQANSLHGILIVLAAVMPVMAIISLVPVVPLLEKEFAEVPGSAFLVPVALTVPALCLALFSPVAGWVADRVGRKSLLVTSLICYAAIGILPYFLVDLRQIIVARIALGITEAAIMTAATTLIGDYFEGDRRERWLGIQVSAISVAAIVLIAIGGALGATLGARGPFLLYLAALPLGLVCWLILFEPHKVRVLVESKEPFPLGRLLPLATGGFFLGVLFYVAIVKLGDIVALKVPPNPALLGGVGAVVNMGVVAGAIVFGVLKTNLSRSGLVALAMALMAAGYAAVPFAQGVPLTAASVFAVCVGAGISIPTFITWVMSVLQPTARGRGVGFWQGAFFLGQFIAPITAVALSSQLGGFSNALMAYSALAIVVGLIAWINTRRRDS
ncbi:MAG: MFS transporter [Henriciella sp.]|uniref:MFS transporter n=1 Tax=Henriciella sp. TaxID=1968823 RepID=UPI003C714D23